jgi:hypothetical protein
MLQVLSRLTQVTSGLVGPGPVELYAVTRAGAPAPVLVVEAYDDDGLVAAGELAVWDLNQALAALLSATSQARRLALREDGRGRGGHLDVVTGDAGADVSVVVTGRARQATYVSAPSALAADLNAMLHHYLDLTRVAAGRTIVLPGAQAAEPAAASASSRDS